MVIVSLHFPIRIWKVSLALMVASISVPKRDCFGDLKVAETALFTSVN